MNTRLSGNNAAEEAINISCLRNIRGPSFGIPVQPIVAGKYTQFIKAMINFDQVKDVLPTFVVLPAGK